jgi:HAE1 family hydrophobic/amphiphilic exporter-1
MVTEEQWVVIDDVSAHLKVNKETVRRWIKSQDFPSHRAGNLMSFIGVIMLMGIVLKNAIVLVDYTKQLKAGGMSLNEAVVTGGKTRLRPVLMTSLTAVFGMLPLALSRGEGSEIWNALGITVIGGLLVSGLVTLILVPLVY